MLGQGWYHSLATIFPTDGIPQLKLTNYLVPPNIVGEFDKVLVGCLGYGTVHRVDLFSGIVPAVTVRFWVGFAAPPMREESQQK